LVITTLTNFLSPFIRYDIVDDVTLADGPCSCGRGLPLWKKVDGRRHPMLYLPNGKRKASTGLFLGLRQIGGVHQFQVIQKADDRFVVNVVPDNTWTEDHAAQIINYIRQEVESSVTVDIEKHSSLDRPTGKLKIVVVEPR
jgi:phenylacetate-CoA ligase